MKTKKGFKCGENCSYSVGGRCKYSDWTSNGIIDRSRDGQTTCDSPVKVRYEQLNKV